MMSSNHQPGCLGKMLTQKSFPFSFPVMFQDRSANGGLFRLLFPALVSITTAFSCVTQIHTIGQDREGR
jgi:hypothetical protein